ADAQTRLDRALVLIDGLDNGRAENQEALERLKYGLLKLSGRAGGPVDTLKTFDEALLRTSLEFYQLQSLEEKLKEVADNPARQPDVALAAAGEALRLYQFLARSAGKPDPVAAERMMAMAALLDQRFPASPQANEGRAILGRDLITKKQYDAASALLLKI